MLSFHLVTLFPEFFDSPLSTGLMRRAKSAGILDFSFHNPRDFSNDRHRHIDDTPYGGGPGMVMRAEPVLAAIESIARPGRILLMSPVGRPLTQKLARELAWEEDISIISGRYEGIDARLSRLLPIEPICVCDCVLNGGESAALAVMEGVARLVPNFMGKPESGDEESFNRGLLEYPHYTHPAVISGIAVPPILLSGNHAAIHDFRRKAAIAATLRHRPDLLDTAPLDRTDCAHLQSLPRERIGRQLSFCLHHTPVMLENGRIGSSSLTNLDIHDIARISCSYGLGPFMVVTSLERQRKLLENLLYYWQKGPGAKSNPDRKEALDLARAAGSLSEALNCLEKFYGVRPLLVASSASWPEHKKSVPPLTANDLRVWLEKRPVMILLGTAHGLCAQTIAECDGHLRPIRFLGYNHLPVRSAAAILADRILGDFH